MKKFKPAYLAFLPLVAIPFFLIAPSAKKSKAEAPARAETITWMTMNEALAANEKEKKLIFIDVYTDWCGWCKVMDKKTFSQPEVAQYMAENFYCVKLNAEKGEPITINGQEFGLVDAGNRKIHTLAYALLDGQMSYPSYVYLNGDLERLKISKGYKEVNPFMAEITKIVENYSVQ